MMHGWHWRIVEMLSKLLKLWAKRSIRQDEHEINRLCGVRPYGIEYRIMLEGGAAQLEAKTLPDDVLDDIDLAWHRIGRTYPRQMVAVRTYYRQGSYRAVRQEVGCSQHMSTVLVKEGELLIKGALTILW